MAALSSSVSSLQASLQLLDASIGTLDAGVGDFPRLCKVLQTTRHFELLPESTLRDAQQALLDEIAPSIAHLLALASSHVEKLARREQALKAKCDLQQGRLSSVPDAASGAARPQRPQQQQQQRGSAARAAELKKLVQKKERLKYTVERLELQSKQRERQLRKSMAAQGDSERFD